ncbi:MAG: SGNH/GDSL hydrolase family protein, partial [Candidatus Tectomicrobia bacterium]|nr:SGNH/GDSL hydrolase family protein [Candidatus Tectomicrobia bacterium]
MQETISYQWRDFTEWWQREPGDRRLAWIVALLVLAAGLTPVGTEASGRFSSLFVFGDSLVDTRNTFLATQGRPEGPVPVSPPYFEGRFSNGVVGSEGLAAQLGLMAEPSLRGGTNYAFGGSRTLRTGPPELPGLLTQVDIFIAAHPSVDSDALHMLSAGSNDLRDLLLAGSESSEQTQASVQTIVGHIIEAIERLAGHQGATFLVLNVPDLGRTPESQAAGFQEAATALVMSFNQVLESALTTLEAELDIRIVRLDAFGLVRRIAARPKRFGLTNVINACLTLETSPFLGNPLDGGTPCENPDEHLFWDFIHPSAAAHHVLATASRQVLFCDANDDGLVTLKDALAVLRSLRTDEELPGQAACN